jgi:hypothetical protein
MLLKRGDKMKGASIVAPDGTLFDVMYRGQVDGEFK